MLLWSLNQLLAKLQLMWPNLRWWSNVESYKKQQQQQQLTKEHINYYKGCDQRNNADVSFWLNLGEKFWNYYYDRYAD